MLTTAAAILSLRPELGHRLAALLGLAEVFAMFCLHCPEPDLWPAAMDTDTSASDTP